MYFDLLSCSTKSEKHKKIKNILTHQIVFDEKTMTNKQKDFKLVLIEQKNCEKIRFVVSELVVGSGRQNN